MSDNAAIFREWFGVSPACGRVCAALYAANGGLVRFGLLAAAAGQTQAGVSLSIKLLRQAMEPDAIQNTRTHGFSMTTVGLADCRAALEDVERRRVAA